MREAIKDVDLRTKRLTKRRRRWGRAVRRRQLLRLLRLLLASSWPPVAVAALGSSRQALRGHHATPHWRRPPRTPIIGSGLDSDSRRRRRACLGGR